MTDEIGESIQIMPQVDRLALELTDLSSSEKPKYETEVREFWTSICSCMVKEIENKKGVLTSSRIGKDRRPIVNAWDNNAVLAKKFFRAMDALIFGNREVRNGEINESTYQDILNTKNNGVAAQISDLVLGYRKIDGVGTGTRLELSKGSISIFQDDQLVLQINKKIVSGSKSTEAVLPLTTETGNRVVFEFDNSDLYGVLCYGLVWSDYFPVRAGVDKHTY